MCLCLKRVYVCICRPWADGEQPASPQGALVLMYFYTCPYILTCAPLEMLPNSCLWVSLESLWRLSEGFGTGGVRHRMGHGFLWVAAVVVNLEQDGNVHAHLQQATCPELHRGLGEQEVARFKSVATGPHQHHLDTVRIEWESWGWIKENDVFCV